MIAAVSRLALLSLLLSTPVSAQDTAGNAASHPKHLTIAVINQQTGARIGEIDVVVEVIPSEQGSTLRVTTALRSVLPERFLTAHDPTAAAVQAITTRPD